MELKNKTVLITGASQGLGALLAQKVAQKGASVILVARNEKRLEAIEAMIKKRKGKADSFSCDISRLPEVRRTVKQILAKFGTIDVLVNNAGIWTDEGLEKKN